MKYLYKYGLYIDTDLVVYRRFSNDGRNRTHVSSCYIQQVDWKMSPSGYKYYHAWVDGKRISVYLHRIIAEAFIPNPLNKPTVDHINRDKLDNRLENLRWATRVEQCQNRRRHKEKVA